MEDTTITPTSEVTEAQAESQNVVDTATSEEVNNDQVNTDEALAEELTKLQESVVKPAPARTEEEKARYTIEKIYERFPHMRDGVAEVVNDDDKPVTTSELRRVIAEMQTGIAEKSALELAESIANPIERKMVQHHIEHTIRPTGNAQNDLALAQSLVNAKRNEVALREQARRGVAKPASSATSAPLKEAPSMTLTAEEQKFVGILTPEQIIAARSKDAYGTRSLGK